MAGNSQKFARINLGIKLISDSVNTQCAVGFSNQKKKRPKGLSIFLSKVVIGDLESVEKIISQQRPLGVTSQSAPANLPKRLYRPVLPSW